ncbi:MAG: hypothetical protein HOP19_16525 [Acidobacteria bacterium]|nr:hypothetical protein [Acidobacteriota bacterium]
MNAANRNLVTQPIPESEAQRSIPFDYTFRFDLLGRPNHKHSAVIRVSVEASFHAVSIGYGIIPPVTPTTFGLSRSDLVAGIAPNLNNIQLNQLMKVLQPARFNKTKPRAFNAEISVEAAFKFGIRLNPQFAELALSDGGAFALPDDALENLFEIASTPIGEIQFLYALFDEGTGREFQSEPLLNTAGLGTSTGERPFRYFARPVTFAPRSVIRMEITEKSDFQGELHVSLHGYKTLGSPGSPTHSQAPRRRVRQR